jgi:hypothetical protein
MVVISICRALAVCAQHRQHVRLASASSSVSTAALCDPIALACRIERMAAVQEGRLLAEVESGRPFHGMRGEASGFCKNASPADFLVGVGVNLNQEGCDCRVASEFTIKLTHAVGCGLLLGSGQSVNFDVVKGAERAGHGWEAVEALASDAHTVTRGGQAQQAAGSQFTICNPWRTPETTPRPTPATIAGGTGWTGWGDAPQRLNPDWRSYLSQPVLRRGDDGLSGRVDRLKALGNAVVPQVAMVPLSRVLELSRCDNP